MSSGRRGDALERTGLRLRLIPSDSLDEDDRSAIRLMLAAAFDDHGPDERFTDADWDHALGGTHAVLDEDGVIVAHASVVERRLHVGLRPLRTGYVEAVGTAPAAQRRGHGRRVMAAIEAVIDEQYELGALGTGVHAFYERSGWVTWQGPTGVRTPEGTVPTPEEDGYIMVRRTPSTPALDFTATLTCEWRSGDAW